MAILKNVGLKTSTIDEIKDNFDGAQGVVVVNYSGLTVEQDTQLRKQLREAGVVYKVYKNTLVKRVVAGTEFEPIADTLEERSFFQSYLEVCSHLLQTLLVLLSRLLRRTRKLLNQFNTELTMKAA